METDTTVTELTAASTDAQTPAAGRVESRALGHYVRVETSLESAVWARFIDPHLTGAEPFARSFELPGAVSVDEIFAGVPDHLIRREVVGPNGATLLIETANFAALLQRWRHGNGAAVIRAASRTDVDRGVERVRSWLPETTVADTVVSVDFWQCGHSMYTTTRSIEAPAWPDVRHHYPGEVGTELDALMTMHIDQPVGRVILWHGPPGTGKTSAIRALARAWRDQARVQVVLDPDAAFAGSTNLMQMLLAGEDDESNPWRILVVEDADRLVHAEQQGPSLSRLLNVGDGIVGQGIRVMVLLTTNEPPARLHPALTRPGRCLSHVHFRRFRRAEALDAFPDRAGELSRAGDVSLARILTGVDDAATESDPVGQYL